MGRARFRTVAERRGKRKFGLTETVVETRRGKDYSFNFPSQKINHEERALPVDIPMAKRTFENALDRLEKIARELEQGDLGLEVSLSKFDEGIQLVKFCNDKLEDAKARVDLLLDRDGKLTKADFDEHHGHQELS